MPWLPMQFGRIRAALWIVNRLNIVGLMQERMLESASRVSRVLYLALSFNLYRLCVPW